MSERSEALRLIRERGRAVHILLEGEIAFTDTLEQQPHRIARKYYHLASALHGCSTVLALLEGHYLRVHSVRSDRKTPKYQFDLRFAHSRPVLVRSIAWGWLFAFITLIGLGAGVVTAMWSHGSPPRTAVIGGTVAIVASFVALGLFLRRTTESLEFRSENGMATLINVTGSIGSMRKGKKFFIELIKSINAAKMERPQPKQQFLRDEMREHYRLFELGVLSEREYRQSKARILAQH